MSNVLNQTSTSQRVLDIDDVPDAILARWEDAVEEQPSEDGEGTADQPVEEAEETVDEVDLTEADEADQDEEDEETELEEDETETEDQEEEDDEDDEDTVQLAQDDDIVEITVNGEVVQHSVAQLKRLAGQEASLTRKSQETASKRKEAEDAISKNHAVFQTLLAKAEERHKPYADVDMLLASKTMDAQDFAALRKEAAESAAELKFLQEEADKFYQDIQANQQAQMQDAAKECVRVLEEDIPEWNNDLYNEIRSYAVSQGLDQTEVDSYVDPAVIKILNKARLFDQGKQVATKKKKVAAKKKVLRSTKAPEGDRVAKQRRLKKTQEKLGQRGAHMDDLTDALLARWEA